MDYDDRLKPRYAEVQARLRNKMMLVTIVSGFGVLTSSVAVYFRGLDLSSAHVILTASKAIWRRAFPVKAGASLGLAFASLGLAYLGLLRLS